MNGSSPAVLVKRLSTAVTVVSLLMAMWFGMLSFTTGIQVFFFTLFLPFGFLHEIRSAQTATLPPFAYFLINHFVFVAYLMLFLCVFTTIAALGVWRRKEKARMAMLIALVAQILMVFAGPAMAILVMQASGPAIIPGAAGRIPYLFAAIALIPSLIFSAAYAWYFYTLTRQHIRAEFS